MKLVRLTTLALPATLASLALTDLVAPTTGTASRADATTRVVEGCHQPVTSARRAKDDHDFTVEQAKAMETKFRGDLKATLGTTDVAAAADLVALAPTTIDVKVHVIADGKPATDVSDAVIARQLEVLNAAYAGTNSGAAASTPFTFRLVSTDRTVDAKLATNVTPGSQAEKKIKAGRSGNASTLNIWITGLGASAKGKNGGQLFGWATFPSDYAKNPAMDGLTIDRRTMEGAPGAFADFSEGDTATHEIGHWLGLYHTFQGGCTGGDEVADTAAEASPASGCPTGRDTCTAPEADPIHNFMDYSNDPCLTQFTQGQADRMAVQWATYRA